MGLASGRAARRSVNMNASRKTAAGTSLVEQMSRPGGRHKGEVTPNMYVGSEKKPSLRSGALTNSSIR